jgi:TonB family protein
MAEPWKQREGQTVNGEFRLGDCLGISPYGAVYRTLFGDPDPQNAAIKLIAANSPGAEQRLASWQLAASLSHPHLIRIFQAGHCQIGGTKLVYVVMEYAEENLSLVVPRRALTEIEVREMLDPSLDALAYLHAKGLSHSRIKPANIMASGDQLKLSADGVRRAGEPISDPGDYDPPETWSSPAGDVWSLGITLVEVLTQRLPSWDRNAQGEPRAAKPLPPAFSEIVRSCLRRDPKRRSTVADIASRLKSPALATRTEPTVQRAVSPAQSWYLIIAVILLLASASFVSVKLLHQSAKRSGHTIQPAKNRSERTAPAPKPVVSATPSETKPATPTETKPPTPIETKPPTPAETETPASASQTPLPAPPAQVKKIPETAARGGVIHQVLPDVPQSARDTIRGTVRVGIKVSVDPSGSVTDATIDSPGPSSYFANLALQAARQWKFAPTRSSASPDWNLRFEFSADDTQAFAEQSAP